MSGDRQARSAPRNVKGAMRRQQALELRAQGWRYHQIGVKLGITPQRAGQLVREALEVHDLGTEEAREQLRRLESERLDQMAAILWPQVQAGHLGAHDRLLRNRESFRRLHGLDATHDVDGGIKTVIVNMQLPGGPPPEIVEGEAQVVEPAELEAGP